MANLFAAAKKDKPTTAAVRKGTTFQLPKNLGKDGKLEGESLVLNNAVHNLIEASKEEKNAKAKVSVAKGQLNGWVETVYCMEWAKLGIQPPTPITLVNHNGETNTFVIQDKTQQYTLKDDQVEILTALLGPEGVTKLVENVDVYSFNSRTMAEPAANAEDSTVQDVIFELVSTAVENDDRLSEEQKNALIEVTSTNRVKPSHLSRLAEIGGCDAGKLQELLGAIGSGSPHYVKA